MITLEQQPTAEATKHCTQCKVCLPVSAFGVSWTTQYGKPVLRGGCRACLAVIARKKHAINPETFRRATREHYHRNKDDIAARRKAGYCTEKATAWYHRKKVELAPKMRAYQKRMRDLGLVQKRNADYLKNRRRSDDAFRFSSYQRSRICGLLRNYPNRERSVALLGASPKDALRLITNGRSTEGYHFDHHVPVSYFDLSEPINRFVCFNWRNLRLLTKEENMRKQATLPDDYQQVIKEIREALSIDSANL